MFSDREERLHVDHIKDENGWFRWTGPGAPAAIFEEPLGIRVPISRVARLVGAMRRMGLLTERGLTATRAAWDGATVRDAPSYFEFRQRSGVDRVLSAWSAAAIAARRMSS